jgi:hypothetical protein
MREPRIDPPEDRKFFFTQVPDRRQRAGPMSDSRASRGGGEIAGLVAGNVRDYRRLAQTPVYPPLILPPLRPKQRGERERTGGK